MPLRRVASRVGKLFAADLAGGVDAGACLVDDDIGELGEQCVGRMGPGRLVWRRRSVGRAARPRATRRPLCPGPLLGLARRPRRRMVCKAPPAWRLAAAEAPRQAPSAGTVASGSAGRTVGLPARRAGPRGRFDLPGASAAGVSSAVGAAAAGDSTGTAAASGEDTSTLAAAAAAECRGRRPQAYRSASATWPSVQTPSNRSRQETTLRLRENRLDSGAPPEIGGSISMRGLGRRRMVGSPEHANRLPACVRCRRMPSLVLSRPGFSDAEEFRRGLDPGRRSAGDG